MSKVLSDIRAGDKFEFVGIGGEDDNPPKRIITVEYVTVMGKLIITITAPHSEGRDTIMYSEAYLLIEQDIWKALKS